MDWVSWDQVGSYNLGTFVTGLVVMVLSARAWLRINHLIARALSVAVFGLGLYLAYRGGYWFIADMLAPPGFTYHPAFTANDAHPDDWRWTIWIAIVPMEAALFGLYVRVFRDHRATEFMIIGGVVAAYIVGGLL